MNQAQADYRAPETGRRIDFTACGAVSAVVSDVENKGFAIAAMGDTLDEPEMAIKRLSSSLALGDPTTPALYRRADTEKYSTPYHGIQSSATDKHPGFSTTDGQAWHVDGLLDEIGKIKTTILYCVRLAYAGGDTLVFNAVAAFAALRAADPEAASALLSPLALERRATIPGVQASATGPVFAIQPDSSVISRFTDNDTCVWNHTVGPTGSLERGLQLLRTAAQEPRYATAVKLAPGEALIFRNDRVSHGRTGYQDGPTARRLLIRALYTRPPQSQASN